ncbi:MAG: DUF4337 domain-containing protein [Burkholderiaceae bacterium]|nr:DUF4337 domain-containing protein [Burkholderiaceae bacterium]
MSEHEFHVHGPHDHALEHAAHNPPGSFAGRLAATTAILATVGSIFSYLGGESQASSARYANDAAIKRTQAVSLWAEYQSASTKQELHALATDVVPEARRAFHEDAARRHLERMERAKGDAEKLEADAVALDARGNTELRAHHRWSRATTVLQISIAMAAIALLTRRRWLQFGVYGLGSVGMLMGLLAWLRP